MSKNRTKKRGARERRRRLANRAPRSAIRDARTTLPTDPRERSLRRRSRVGAGAEERRGDLVARDRVVAAARAFVEARGFEVRVAEDRRGTRARVAQRLLELGE